MKQYVLAIALMTVGLLSGLSSGLSLAQTPTIAKIATPEPPTVAAPNYMLLDVTANQVLASKDVDVQIEPASLTKLMTAYLVFEALNAGKLTLQQKLPVSERAWKMPGSRMFIDPKMQVSVDDLLKGMIVQSGNDATVALAEGVGGTVEHFVHLMNEQAKAMGMKGTAYRNPEGLTAAGHLTTARDLSILAMRLMRDFPQHMHYYAIKHYRLPGTPSSNSQNRNLLLFRDPSVDGLKTGHTNAAGYCLVATANRDVPSVGSRRLLSIVLGTSSQDARANESQKLLNWGYTAFVAHKLFDAAAPMSAVPIWKGAQPTLQVGREAATVITVPSGSDGHIQSRLTIQEPLMAPITRGTQVGTLQAMLGEQVLSEMPVFALEDVGEGGVWQRAWDSVRLWFR